MKITPIEVEPHVAGLLVGGLLPNVPLETVQPVSGEISQFDFEVLLHEKFPVFTNDPFVEVFVKVIVLLIQTLVSDIEKLAVGLVEILIGVTDAPD